MAALPTSDETKAIVAYARAFDPEVVVTATTGGKHVPSSYHYRQGTNGKGLAVDLAYGGANKAAKMLAMAQHFDAVGSRCAELFHNPLGHSYIDGRRTSYLEPGHFDHIHIAVLKGTFLAPILTPAPPAPKPETPAPAQPVTSPEDQDMIQYEWPNGAIVSVDTQGNAYCPNLPGRPVAKHFGGMPALRDNAKKAFSGRVVCVVGVDRNNSDAGYLMLDESWAANGEVYKFDPSVGPFLK